MATFITNISNLTMMKREILMRFRRDRNVTGLCPNMHSEYVLEYEVQYLDFIKESKYNLLSDLPENLLYKVKTFREEESIDHELIVSNELNNDDINFILTIRYTPTIGEIVSINNEIGIVLNIEPYLLGYGYDIAIPRNGGHVVKYPWNSIVIDQDDIHQDDIIIAFSQEFLNKHSILELFDTCNTESMHLDNFIT
jgi:hypothetical protein